MIYLVMAFVQAYNDEIEPEFNKIFGKNEKKDKVELNLIKLALTKLYQKTIKKNDDPNYDKTVTFVKMLGKYDMPYNSHLIENIIQMNLDYYPEAILYIINDGYKHGYEHIILYNNDIMPIINDTHILDIISKYYLFESDKFKKDKIIKLLYAKGLFPVDNISNFQNIIDEFNNAYVQFIGGGRKINDELWYDWYTYNNTYYGKYELNLEQKLRDYYVDLGEDIDNVLYDKKIKAGNDFNKNSSLVTRLPSFDEGDMHKFICTNMAVRGYEETKQLLINSNILQNTFPNLFTSVNKVNNFLKNCVIQVERHKDLRNYDLKTGEFIWDENLIDGILVTPIKYDENKLHKEYVQEPEILFPWIEDKNHFFIA
jgi:hypothetical protein